MKIITGYYKQKNPILIGWIKGNQKKIFFIKKEHDYEKIQSSDKRIERNYK